MTTGDKRRDIVDRAAELFHRDGYESATLEDVATAVGLRKPTIYHYFDSKDDILASIHDEMIEPLIEKLERRQSFALPASQRLLEVMADVFELVAAQRAHYAVFLDHYRQLDWDTRLRVAAKRERYARNVQQIVEDGIAAGEFRTVDPRLACLLLFGVVNWAARWNERDKGGANIRATAYQFWNILMDGIGERDGQPAVDPAPTMGNPGNATRRRNE